MKRVPEYMTENARQLRNAATDVERKLWHELRIWRPRFTRQLVVGRYILDIACRDAKLAIELDGSQHFVRSEQDAKRTAELEALGWRVLRFWNREVLENMEGAVTAILNAVASRTGDTHPQPLPSREGRRKARQPSPPI